MPYSDETYKITMSYRMSHPFKVTLHVDTLLGNVTVIIRSYQVTVLSVPNSKYSY